MRKTRCRQLAIVGGISSAEDNYKRVTGFFVCGLCQEFLAEQQILGTWILNSGTCVYIVMVVVDEWCWWWINGGSERNAMNERKMKI